MEWQTLGSEKEKAFFEARIAEGTFAHAYIFSGQEMIGKRTFALELVKKINKAITDPDVLIVQPAEEESSITIESIRDLKNFLSLSPYGIGFKFVVINDAHLMGIEAQNAILKILEEPSPSSKLLLITHNPQQLLQTIFSRCQEILFTPHVPATLAKVFEGSSLTEPQQQFLISFVHGRIGLLKNMLADNSFKDIRSHAEEITALLKNNLAERFVKAKDLAEEPNLPSKVLYWMLYLHQHLSGPQLAHTLSNLMNLYSIIQQPQLNKRLALERCMLQL